MKYLGANGLKIPLRRICPLPLLPATPYSLSWTLEGLFQLTDMGPFKGSQPSIVPNLASGITE